MYQVAWNGQTKKNDAMLERRNDVGKTQRMMDDAVRTETDIAKKRGVALPGLSLCPLRYSFRRLASDSETSWFSWVAYNPQIPHRCCCPCDESMF